MGQHQKQLQLQPQQRRLSQQQLQHGRPSTTCVASHPRLLHPCTLASLVSCLQDYSVLDKLSTVHCVTLKGVSAATGHCCKLPLHRRRREVVPFGPATPTTHAQQANHSGMAIPQVAIKCSARILTLLDSEFRIPDSVFRTLATRILEAGSIVDSQCPTRLPDFQFQFRR